ncbi:MAG: protein tyrosine phosphatase [Hyphomicrobiales bacterium]|nr:MAG: protein tyrosine phosphatase [Hyphomicrobiales bacterium]
MLFVCPLSRLHETVENSGASHMVTLINDGTPVARPPSIAAENHLFLGFNDITEPMDGFLPPNHDIVGRFIAFADAWSQERAMVVHCWAGISRSTAGAYVVACMKRGAGQEAAIAAELRAAAPQATPNSLFVKIADDILGRGGAMSEAIASIGRGASAFEGSPFGLSLS